MLKEIISGLTVFKRRDDDDIIDRLHYFLTTNLLLALAILVSFKQFGGKPIECMVPEMFPGGWEQYAENYCWAQDTYFIPFTKHAIPVRGSRERGQEKISYYQWVPFFLLLEASCFLIPALFWKLSSGHSGIRMDDIVKIAMNTDNIRPEIRKNTIRILSVHLENALRFHRRLSRRSVIPHKFLRFLNLPYTACYVTVTYLTTKAFYLINVLVQWFLMNAFLGTKSYSYYGWGALTDILNGTEWHTSGVFPRVTLCDFDVRAVGSNVQPFTIQCVLVINLFNEKIFIFLWFWYLILALLTLLSLIYWGVLMICPCFSRWYISRHLELSEMPFDPKGCVKEVEKFVYSYLKTDGIFVLRMCTMHTGIIFGTDLILSLWHSFYGIETQVQRQTSSDPGLTPESDLEQNKLNILRLRALNHSGAAKDDKEKLPDNNDQGDDDNPKKLLITPDTIINMEYDLTDSGNKVPMQQNIDSGYQAGKSDNSEDSDDDGNDAPEIGGFSPPKKKRGDRKLSGADARQGSTLTSNPPSAPFAQHDPTGDLSNASSPLNHQRVGSRIRRSQV